MPDAPRPAVHPAPAGAAAPVCACDAWTDAGRCPDPATVRHEATAFTGPVAHCAPHAAEFERDFAAWLRAVAD